MNKFIVAFRGLLDACKDKSVFIQLILGWMALGAGLVLRFSLMEMIAVILCIGLVVTTEMLNTCIELVCNRITVEQDDAIGRIKDMAAGAVLFSSMIALVVAVLIFLKHVGGF
ncbi:MAG: diacylglycerol kinase family protein [Erysipelotrichaceae bacterium]|nr:diacylglycerol kinase family protein [Erysipelotrichaceae bacterium]